jgi:flagellar capping protein FliD
MLEWLLFTISDQDVRSKRVEKAIDFLISNIYDNRQLKWPIGPRGHATRALSLYDKRLSEILSEPQEQSDAQQDSSIAGSSGDPSSNSESASPRPLVNLPQGAATQGAVTQSTPQRTSKAPGNASSPARVGTAQRVVRPARPRR